MFIVKSFGADRESVCAHLFGPDFPRIEFCVPFLGGPMSRGILMHCPHSRAHQQRFLQSASRGALDRLPHAAPADGASLLAQAELLPAYYRHTRNLHQAAVALEALAEAEG
jgi:hypothetical protein